MAVRSLYAEPEAESTAERPPALEFRDVFRIFHSGPVETVALRGLNLRVEAGELVAVLGPSGCGKSTMLSLAAGLDQPSAGEVRLFGRSLARLDDDELADVRASEIALVLQRENLWSALSAIENVTTSLRLAGRSRAAGAAAALAELGLADRRRHRVGALSGGEQQRVAIAAAAARGASLVLADEPTGELDRANEAGVLDAIQRLRTDHGSTVVMVTHSEAVAGRADRVIEMTDGRARA